LEGNPGFIIFFCNYQKKEKREKEEEKQEMRTEKGKGALLLWRTLMPHGRPIVLQEKFLSEGAHGQTHDRVSNHVPPQKSLFSSLLMHNRASPPLTSQIYFLSPYPSHPLEP